MLVLNPQLAEDGADHGDGNSGHRNPLEGGQAHIEHTAEIRRGASQQIADQGRDPDCPELHVLELGNSALGVEEVVADDGGAQGMTRAMMMPPMI